MKKFALALAVALPLTVLTPVTPAQAGVPCNFKVTVSWTAHTSRTVDTSGGCKKVGAQHLYWPRCASKWYLTKWYWTTKDSVYTESQSEIQEGYGRNG